MGGYQPPVTLGPARFQGIEVSFGVEPVLPFLVEDGQQALTHRVAIATTLASAADDPPASVRVLSADLR